jgi:type II secretory pathway component PulJ
MGAMSKRALTLIELTVSLTLVGVILVALIPQFIMLTRLKMDMDDRVYAMREALVVMEHMSRVLRFAEPEQIKFDDDRQELQAKIRKDHLTAIPNDTVCTYKRDSSNALIFTRKDLPEGQQAQIISNEVTFFDIDNTGGRLWDLTSRRLTLRFTVTKNNAVVPMETTIKVIGE